MQGLAVVGMMIFLVGFVFFSARAQQRYDETVELFDYDKETVTEEELERIAADVEEGQAAIERNWWTAFWCLLVAIILVSLLGGGIVANGAQ